MRFLIVLIKKSVFLIKKDKKRYLLYLFLKKFEFVLIEIIINAKYLVKTKKNVITQ